MRMIESHRGCPVELVAKLKTLAKEEGLGYQTYIRQVLTRHVREASISVSKKESA